mmetsp:Transcript_21012/g.58206  ORF Transcript_21012/g.58206 Transcript_21012/m.58206 type:complete len:133 (+) Transcript_21012:219-617(+)
MLSDFLSGRHGVHHARRFAGSPGLPVSPPVELAMIRMATLAQHALDAGTSTGTILEAVFEDAWHASAHVMHGCAQTAEVGGPHLEHAADGHGFLAAGWLTTQAAGARCRAAVRGHEDLCSVLGAARRRRAPV